MPAGDRGAQRGAGGAWGGCPAGLPHALTHGRTLSAAAFPPRACPRLPLEPPQECGNLTRAGSAVPARGRGHFSTLPRLGGPAGGWYLPASHGMGHTQTWCGPCPLPARLAPLDPQNREGETGSMQAGCAPGNLDSGGMGTGGDTSSWPCPFAHKCNPFLPKGHRRVHSHACSPRTQTPAHELRACARSRSAPVGAAPPATLPHPRSHTRPWPQAPPPFPAPRAPPRPQFLFTVMEPPARPSPHRRGGDRGTAGAAASLVPGTGADGFPAVRDHPMDARPRLILGKAAGNPDGEKSWTPRGIGMGRVPRSCCEWSVGAPARCWDVPAPQDCLAGAGSYAQVGGSRQVPCPGSRCVTRSRGRNPALGRTHCAAFPSAEPR